MMNVRPGGGSEHRLGARHDIGDDGDDGGGQCGVDLRYIHQLPHLRHHFGHLERDAAHEEEFIPPPSPQVVQSNIEKWTLTSSLDSSLLEMTAS